MIEWVVTASALVLAVILLRALFRKHISRRLQYGLWLLVMVRLLVPISLLDSPISLMNVFPTATAQIKQQRILPVPMDAAEKAAGTTDRNAPTPGNENSDAATPTKPESSFAGIFKGAWACGAVAVGLWFVGANGLLYAQFRKTRRKYSVPGCRLPVYISDATASPCLFGALKPTIYLTPKAILTRERVDHVIAHELCHYRLADHIWSLMRGVCIAMWWWNPLVWIAASLSQTDSEFACDEAAIRILGENNRYEYSKTLVDMIPVKSGPGGLLCSATNMSASKNGMKERLYMIIKHPKSLLPAVIAVVLAIVICAGCTYTGKSQPPNAKGAGGNDDKAVIASGDTLAQKQAKRLAEYLADFAETPRGEEGFKQEYGGDWDGDGKPDKAYFEKRDPSDTEYRQSVIVEFGNGQKIKASAQEMESMSYWGHSFLLEATDLNGDGKKEILLLIDLGGQGGRGSYGLYPYTQSEKGWELMDMPQHGYTLSLDWKDGKAVVASGNYTETVADASMIQAHYTAAYENGMWQEVKEVPYQSDNAADAICDIALKKENGRMVVKLSQYTTGMTGSHADGLGYLVTTLAWDRAGKCAVEDMRFVLSPQ